MPPTNRRTKTAKMDGAIKSPTPHNATVSTPKSIAHFSPDSVQHDSRGQVANEMTQTVGCEHEADDAVGDVKRFGIQWQNGNEQAATQSDQEGGDIDGKNERIADDGVHEAVESGA